MSVGSISRRDECDDEVHTHYDVGPVRQEDEESAQSSGFTGVDDGHDEPCQDVAGHERTVRQEQ